MIGDPQRTIARAVSLEGVGLHTGAHCTLTFKPAETASGVRFVRTDLPGHPTVQVRAENAHFDPAAGRRTILQEHGVQIHTMEHVLAAAAGMGVDNLTIEQSAMESPEPADGSALVFAQALQEAGLVDQDRPRRHVKITRPVEWSEGDVTVRAVPYRGFRITFTVEYDHPLIGTQSMCFDVDPKSFLTDIAPARTFVLERDLELLRQAGWIRGGRLESAIVVGSDRILNPEPLRFPDEFVRHKVLDLLGDLMLLGGPVQGHVIAHRSGHQSHVAFVKRVREVLPLPGRRPGAAPEEWDITAIMDLLPHRYPFLLVDRITRLDEGHGAEGIKNVTINEPFFQGHFPGHPIMPAVLILEAMAQVGGMLLLHSVESPEGKLMYFMGIDKAKFRRPVTPGDQLRFVLTLIKQKKGTAKIRGEAFVDGQLVAEAELLAMIVDRRAT
ncbi:MAG: bifunctional UDP-3-O-[3-hydroxymyristoyl] N-acetylglucosamine deacetylase/3-hydroxyacyl-ACP dehydratase [Candidatus Eisenbacteria bacterium]|uniref:Multifunctional fusion protein n=1 Tax=Eiseniibacteriota bacterium TaxID=2212470 RepID=A0A849SMB0_UNCEI|nr:bifunctional UDP-3-O-[3-hydroxymyristoyl] N-acetylglucosamine deacetylase/3-hydroxyacyl-ACP dehydratase [Candidatus Eisenbacteria bacterium]